MGPRSKLSNHKKRKPVSKQTSICQWETLRTRSKDSELHYAKGKTSTSTNLGEGNMVKQGKQQDVKL